MFLLIVTKLHQWEKKFSLTCLRGLKIVETVLPEIKCEILVVLPALIKISHFFF